MAFVRVEQRNAHLAGSVRLEFVNGREGKVAKGTLTAISNTRRGSGEGREDEATAIQWTLWGKQAENAAEYLGKGSHVNVVGRLRNNNYEKDGEEVYALAFTCEEIDYLDSRPMPMRGAHARMKAPQARTARTARPTVRRPSPPAAARYVPTRTPGNPPSPEAGERGGTPMRPAHLRLNRTCVL